MRNEDGVGVNDPLDRLTKPSQAYLEGKRARLENLEAKTWEGLLPYSVSSLANPWLDGWNGVKVIWDKDGYSCGDCYWGTIILGKCSYGGCRKHTKVGKK